MILYVCASLKFTIKLKFSILGSISVEDRPMFLDQHIEKVVDERTHKKQFMCTLCSKLHSQKIHCQNHLESIHFPDMFNYSCSYCGKTFNGKNKLYVHVSLTHKVWYLDWIKSFWFRRNLPLYILDLYHINSCNKIP